MKKIKNLNFLYDIVFSILVFSLPLSKAVPNICMVVLFLLFLLKFEFKKRDNRVLIGITILVGYFTIKAILNNTFLTDISIHKHLFTVLLIGVLIQKVNKIEYVKGSFVLGVLTATIFSLIKIVIYFLENKTIPFGNTDQLSELLTVDRPYIGFMCVLAIIFSFEIMLLYKKYKLVLLVVITFLVCFISLISARLSLITLVIILFIEVIRNNHKNRKMVSIVTLFIFVVFSFMFYTNSNLQKRFHIENTIEETVEKLTDYEPRVVIWNCSLMLFKEQNKFFGYSSFSTVNKRQTECYEFIIPKDSKRQYYLEKKFNTHNQFLDFLLSGGIFGLIIFIFIFIEAYRIEGFINISLITAFLLFCLVENVLWRQWGAYLFGIFIPMIHANLKTNIKKNIHD